MRADNPPTALFCMNDIAATQVYQLLHASGYSIPDDVSVAGFDNIKIGRYLSPPLTTIDIPKKAMGQEAVKLLLTRAENPNEYTKTVYVSTEVVLRDSVKKLLL